MQMRIVEISVGAFIIAGTLALAFLAFEVSGLGQRPGTGDTYTLEARFENASGLGTRARVSIAGVVVGRVTDIRLDPFDQRAVVRMAIDRDVDYITEDSIAAIKTAGILGEKYVSISIGAMDELLGDGDEIFDTQSTLVLEDLIGRFLTGMGN